MNIYARILAYARPYVAHMAAAVACTLVLSATSSAIAYLVKPAIDDVFLKKDFSMLVLIPVLVVVAYVIKGLSDFGQAYCIGYIGNRAVTDLREALYCHIQSLSMSFFTRTSTGLLMSRIANDVGVLRHSLSDSAMDILRNTFMVIGLTGVAFYQNWKMAAICFVMLPLVIVPITKFGSKGKRYSRRSQEQIGRISTFLDETISGNLTVKSFCMESYAIERFFQETARLLRSSMQSLKVSALSSPVMELCGGFLGGAIMYYGGYSVIQGRMTAGEFFSFVTALAMLYRPIKSLSRENLRVQRGMAAAVRIFEILDLVPDIQDRPGARELPPVRETVAFRDVCFQYEDRPVLKNVSLVAAAGEVVAIVGHSGAGKTTIANLLLRFYDVTAGAILIDGIDIRDVTVRSLRQRIAFVTQETILFNDTVRNNIAYGSPEVSDEQIFAAARAAYAHEFIQAMPEGYDTLIGEKGARLSGGQRQRLAIARALVKNAPILILDEATSSLDTHSEREVQRALENLMRGRTTFLIAHRLSTVRNADQIIVLAEGEVVERGNHADLMEHKGIYNRLIEIQGGYQKQPAGHARGC